MTTLDPLHPSYFPPTPRARPRSLLPEAIPRSLPAPNEETAQLQTSLSSYSLAAPLDTEWTFPTAIAAGKASRRQSQLEETLQSPKSQPITPGLELANPFENVGVKEEHAHGRSWSDPTILTSTASQPAKVISHEEIVQRDAMLDAIDQDRQQKEERWQDEPEAEMEYDFEKEFKALGLGARSDLLSSITLIAVLAGVHRTTSSR